MPTSRLSDLLIPGKVRCVNVECTGDAMVRLKRMGICDQSIIEVIQPGDPMVLRVVGTRLGVSRRLAESVVVDRVSTVVSSTQFDADENE
ncbi:MAG: ferrous iron transport protein A [Fuerstiella sp.]|nr:ferrous iron transport protein A [Fuerstiella sp.]